VHGHAHALRCRRHGDDTSAAITRRGLFGHCRLMEELGQVLDELIKIISRLPVNKKELKLVGWKRVLQISSWIRPAVVDGRSN
jgi:hypothetical protein